MINQSLDVCVGTFFMNSNLVAIQGVRGSFHHIAAMKVFSEQVHVNPCQSFDAAVQSLLSGNSNELIMALENSIAGSILPNYALIDANDLVITAECYLDVQHHLMVLGQQTMSDLKEVHSHPMALLQCKEYLKRFPHLKLVEAKDTAEVAQWIKTKQIKEVAAIASKAAAELFDLTILASSIQTIKHNETRFVVLNRRDEQQLLDMYDKASLKFELSHKRGSLASVLNVLSDCNLNLTKIQSLPKIHTPWKYAFFVDVTFDDVADYSKARDILNIMAENFRVLGVYKNAKA
jgi:prephenate dehydratase